MACKWKKALEAAMVSAVVLLAVQAPAHAEDADDQDSMSAADEALQDMTADLEDFDQSDEVRPGRRKMPRLQTNSTVRIGLSKSISKDVTLEAFTRAGSGMLGAPYSPSSSNGAGGVALSWKIGKFTSSTSVEKTVGYKGEFSTYAVNGTIISQGLARSFKITPAWGITPAISGAYAMSSAPKQELVQVGFAMPVEFVSGSWTFQPLIPRVTYQSFTTISRRDVTLFAGAGVKWNVTSAVSLSTSLGFQQKYSTVARAESTRWVLAPQLAFKLKF